MTQSPVAGELAGIRQVSVSMAAWRGEASSDSNSLERGNWNGASYGCAVLAFVVGVRSGSEDVARSAEARQSLESRLEWTSV